MRINLDTHYLEVEVKGDGEELVVLYPSVSRKAEDLYILSEPIVNAGYKTVCINQRGIGGSTGNTKGIKMTDLAGDIAGVIRELGFSKAHVVGHLFSSTIVRVLAEKHPESVSSIILIGISGVLPAYINGIDALEAILTLDPNDLELHKIINNTFFADGNDSSVFYDGFDRNVLYDLFTGPLATSPRHDWLHAGKCPVLVIQGLEDKLSPPESGYYMKSICGRRIQIVNISGAAHNMVHEKPEMVSSAIIKYIKNFGCITNELSATDTFYNEKKDQKSKVTSKYELGYHKSIIRRQSLRKISQYAKPFLPHLKNSMRLLDCGCGPGSLTIGFAEYLSEGEAVGIDIQQKMIEVASRTAAEKKINNVDFRLGDIYNLQFDDNSFDAVWVCTVISNLERPIEGLKEILRVLKPSGVIAITDGDWLGDIIYPVYPILIEQLKDIERRFKMIGMDTDRAVKNSSLLNNAGYRNVISTAVQEYYGDNEETRDLADFNINFYRAHFSGLKSELGFQVVENTWKEWAEHPDAFYSRIHAQAIGWK